MENNPTIIQALGDVPGLVEAAKAIIRQNEKTNSIFAKALEQRAQAEIPIEEVQKVVRHITESIQHTPCAAPDVSEASELIAQTVLNRTQGAVEDAVREAVKNTPVTLEHQHNHVTALGLVKFAEEKTRNLLTLVSIGFCALLFWISVALVWYYHSETYWGKQYVEIASSTYATEAEKNMLWADIYAESALPKGYSKNPSYFQAKIKQNKKVLKQRRRKGKDKNGNYSTEIPLER